jgi:hypothetical protein
VAVFVVRKKSGIASYTKALFVQKWQMFSESDRRGLKLTVKKNTIYLRNTIASISPACTSQPQTSTNQPASDSTVNPIQLSDLSDTESDALANISLMVNEQFSVYGTQAQFSATGSDFRGGLPFSCFP